MQQLCMDYAAYIGTILSI